MRRPALWRGSRRLRAAGWHCALSWLALLSLLAGLPCLTLAAEVDKPVAAPLNLPPDLRLPLPDAELPSFAGLDQPHDVEFLPDQPGDATAPLPDDPSRRLLPLPPELAPGMAPQDEGGRPQYGPDYVEARGHATFDHGVVTISGGGATLYINSLVAGTTIAVACNSALYNTNTGEAELSGDISLEVPAIGLSLKCSYFNYDPLMQRMQLEGAQVQLPLALLPAGTLPEHPPRAQFSGHFLVPTPDHIYFQTQLAKVDYNPRRRMFEMSHVRLTTNNRPDPDFYVEATSLAIGQNDRLDVTGISVNVSGYRVFAWPRYRRSAKSESNPLSFGFPSISLNRSQGVRWKQPVTFILDQVKIQGTADYSDQYGLLFEGAVARQVSPSLAIGLSEGSRNVAGLERQRIQRKDSLVGTAEYDVAHPVGWVQRLHVSLEYGDVTAKEDPIGNLPPPAAVSAKRLYANGQVDFDPVPLGGNIFFTAGSGLRYVDYGGLGKKYSVISGEAGFVLPAPRDGWMNYITYRRRNIEGKPLMGFDEVRRQEVDFAGQLRVQPQWRQTLHGVYDIDKREFETLELGAMKRQRSYELGMYYDFARESAGLELGLRVD